MLACMTNPAYGLSPEVCLAKDPSYPLTELQSRTTALQQIAQKKRPTSSLIASVACVLPIFHQRTNLKRSSTAAYLPSSHDTLNDPITPEQFDRSLQKLKVKLYGPIWSTTQCWGTSDLKIKPTCYTYSTYYVAMLLFQLSKKINCHTSPKTSQKYWWPIFLPPNIIYILSR